MVKSKAIWLSFLITLLLVLFLASRIEQPVAGATSVKLIAGCSLDVLDTRLQPVFTVALACPRTDYIRLWPLPIKKPWFEDPVTPERVRKLKEGFQKPSWSKIVIQ